MFLYPCIFAKIKIKKKKRKNFKNPLRSHGVIKNNKNKNEKYSRVISTQLHNRTIFKALKLDIRYFYCQRFHLRTSVFEYFSDSLYTTIRRERIVISLEEWDLNFARRCPVTEVMEGNEQEFEIYRAFEHRAYYVWRLWWVTDGDVRYESSARDIDKSV